MNFSSLKKVAAGVSVAAISLAQVGSVFAAYRDVPAGVWYEDAVQSFMDAGYLDASQTYFRGGENANRAEFVKLVVELNGGILSAPPAVPSFDDVRPGQWFYGYMEEAAKEGWVRGDGNCYGSHPCYSRPSANINRAEAAALIVRSFGLEWTGDASQFVDNPSGQWYTDAVQTAADHCVLQGDDATSRVRPSDNMNRAEMVVMLHRVDQGLTYGVDCGEGSEVQLPALMTVMATSSTTVEVEFNVPLDSDTAEDVSHYSVPGLTVDSVSLSNSTTVELTLSSAMSAGQDYTLTVDDMMATGGGVFSDSFAFVGYSPLIKGDGVVELSLSASNPVGDTVPQGAVGVVFLSVDFTASCDDTVTITDLTLLHEGFGAETDLSGVYAAIEGARVTRKRTIDSEDQTSDLRFSSPLVLAPCESVTVDFVGDFSTSLTSGAEHNLAVELPSDLQGDAKEVRGNFPLRGNTFRIAAVTSGTVTIAYRTVSPDQVEVGNKGVVVGKFEISTNSVEDQTFYSMTLEQNSSASDADLSNIAIRRSDGTVLTNVASQTVGDFVTLVFDPPFTLLEGDKITLEVVTDIVGGAGDSIILHFEESSDIFAVGSLYGYGVNGQLYGSQITLPTETSSLPDTVTIDAGEFTIEIDGPAQKKFTRDDKDAVLANILFKTGGESVDIKDLFIAVEGETSTGYQLAKTNGTTTDHIHEVLEDVEIRNTITGRTVSAVRLTGTDTFGQQTDGVNSGTFQIYRFDDFILQGNEKWEFRVDFIDNGASASPRSGDQFRIHICGEPTHILSSNSLIANTTTCNFGEMLSTASTAYQMTIEGVSTGDKVGDVRPRGNIAGNFHRIANASLSVAVKAGVASGDTAVKNAKNINLLRFEARAGEAEDILVTKAIFKARSGSLLNSQNYALWVDTDGDSVVDTILEDGIASQTDQVTFADLAGGGFVVPAEDTVIFEVHSDVAASLTNNDLFLAFDTGTTVQASYIEAEELDDGSSLSGIKTGATCQTDSDTTAETNCDITVTTSDATHWLLVSQGDLFVNIDQGQVRSRQLLGGTLADPVLHLQFRASNEAIDVTDVQITSSGSNAASVDRLELYKVGETTPFGYATIGGCGADDVLLINPGHQSAAVNTFCANLESRQLVVPEGEFADVLVRPRMKTDLAGATSNQAIQLWLTNQPVSTNSTGSGAVRARGDESSNNLDANDGDSTAEGEVFIGRTAANATNLNLLGSTNTTVLAKIASITNANPDPNGTNIPSGVNALGQFKFTAAAHENALNGPNKMILSGVTFNVSSTTNDVGLAEANWKFYEKNNSSTKVTCDSTNTNGLSMNTQNSGSFLVTCHGLDTNAVDTELNPGESATFVLEGDVVASIANSTLQISLQDFTDRTRQGMQSLTSTGSNIQWLDKDTTTTNFFWVEFDGTTVNSTSYKN